MTNEEITRFFYFEDEKSEFEIDTNKERLHLTFNPRGYLRRVK